MWTCRGISKSFLVVAPCRSFPSPVAAMVGSATLGFSRELRTRPIRNRPRTSRWGQVEHRPVATSSTNVEPPQRAHSSRATSRRNKGNPYLKSALAQIATGAAKTDTFLGERYRRLIKRMPKAKALVALQRSILVVFFHLLNDPAAEFTDLGADFYQHRIDRARRTTHLLRQLHALGYEVQLTEPAA